jgi:hypothetical protein
MATEPKVRQLDHRAGGVADTQNVLKLHKKRTKEKLPSARLTLHSTKLCTEFKIFRKKIFFGFKVTSEAFLNIFQNLKVTRLQGGTQTKL